MKNYTAIISIPGPWETEDEVKKALEGDGGRYRLEGNEGRYRLVGNEIINVDTEESFGVKLYDFGPNKDESYKLTGNDTFSAEDLTGIRGSNLTVVFRMKLESLAGVWATVKAVKGVLDAGGLAVKIETTGIAYTKDAWYRLSASRDHMELVNHFVIAVQGEGYLSTYGMCTFELPDVQVDYTGTNVEEVSQTLTEFNLYQMRERRVFGDGNTFRATAESKGYVVTHVVDDRHGEDTMYYNPYGLILLQEPK